eukprot:jgi/Bigna1/141214/aug1.61_g15922
MEEEKYEPDEKSMEGSARSDNILIMEALSTEIVLYLTIALSISPLLLKFEMYPEAIAVFEPRKFIAVGSSALTGNTWDGQLSIIGISGEGQSDKMHKIQSVRTTAGITSLAFAGVTDTPLLLSAGDDGDISCWQTAKGVEKPLVPKPVSTLRGHGSIVTSLSVQRLRESTSAPPKSSSQLLSSSYDHKILLWDLAVSAEPIGNYLSHTNYANQVRWSKTDPNPFFSTDKDGYILFWDKRGSKPSGGLRHSEEVSCFDTHSHHLIFGSSSGGVGHIDMRKVDGAHIAVGGENSQLHVYATEQLDSATKRQREKQRRNISSAPPVTMQMRSVFGDFVRDIKWISSIKGNNGCEV